MGKGIVLTPILNGVYDGSYVIGDKEKRLKDLDVERLEILDKMGYLTYDSKELPVLKIVENNSVLTGSIRVSEDGESFLFGYVFSR